ncbi:DeoR/GlpR transcriptional regulator [Listeria weihenstephanensis]|uniref:DeoR/GlpR transcriptional regulator n=1 Tax=Listeria weihenstephanensis TaxID=1006155 RepID=A0A841Z432_9LIST|nr:DeoR/GlpR family DNA-binding transcription regulator [Listeria weihenstephanensis]MBC1499207.1 DeoR/GlpR transcriptional regulator [Listeria weihenstephanensis]
MLNAERHNLIMDLLKLRGSVKLRDIMDASDSSESTVRRDLADLEEQGLLKRVHGGAILSQERATELSMGEKSVINVREKKEIARIAALTVADGDCIYLDAGSTTFEIIHFLAGRDITVVTNGLMHVEELVSLDLKAYILGGKMKAKTKAVIGGIALENIMNYRFDKAFIGANGINIVDGYTTPDMEEALLKRRVMNLSDETFIVADRTKLHHSHFAKMFDLEDAVIIIDQMEAEDKARFMKKTTVMEALE